MKRLFYFTGSLFFLAMTLLVGFHLGQRTAQAQAPSPVANVWLGSWFDGSSMTFVLQNGDLYDTPVSSAGVAGATVYRGNLFTGASPTAIQSSSWGAIKRDLGK